MIFATSARFKHPNFDIKGGTIHSILPFFSQYCYATKICTDFLLVKMVGNINDIKDEEEGEF
jgi:hypothetical protein